MRFGLFGSAQANGSDFGAGIVGFPCFAIRRWTSRSDRETCSPSRSGCGICSAQYVSRRRARGTSTKRNASTHRQHWGGFAHQPPIPGAAPRSGSAQANGSSVRVSARASTITSISTSRPKRSASQHVPGRAPFHRLVAGLGNAEPPDLPRGTQQDPAPRHGCHGSALAQSGAARRAGRDPRRTLGRPARFRDWQGLSPQRIHRLLHPKRGGRRAVRGRPGGYPQGMDHRRALLPSWQVLEFRQYRRRACRRTAAAASDLDGCG